MYSSDKDNTWIGQSCL